jgi:hypothetical protein
MAAGERVRVLLQWLGAPRLATLRAGDVKPAA